MINKKTIAIVSIVIFIGAVGIYYSLGALNKIPTENIMIESTTEIEREENTDNLIEENVTTSEIYVHICGEVNTPGVYIVKENSRLIDLVELAGGLTKDATNSVNLAQIVSDGQRIEILSVEDEKNLLKNNSIPEENKISSNLVNINTATINELMTLTGIGSSKAKSIISYRDSNNGFKSIEELMNIEGIKEGVFNKIKDSITINWGE